MATSTNEDDDYIDSFAGQGQDQSSDDYIDSFAKGSAKAVSAEPVPASSFVPMNPEIADTRAALGPASPERSQAITMGTLRGAADIGNTALNAMDPMAQYLENKLGVPFGPTVSEARSVRDESLKNYEADYGHQGMAQAARVGAQIAMTAPIVYETGNLLMKVPGVRPALEFLQKTKTGRFVKRAAVGAGIGGETSALLSGGSEEPASTQIGIGTAVGAATNPLLEPLAGGVVSKAGDLYNWFKSMGQKVFRGTRGEASAPNLLTGSTGEPIVDALREHGQDLGTLTPRIQQSMAGEAKDQLAKTGAIDADSLARKANLEALGLKVHSSMVSKNPLHWRDEREAAKTDAGKQFMDDYTENNTILEGHLQKIADDTKGVAANDHEAAESVVKAVNDVQTQAEGDAAGQFDLISAQHGNKAGIKPDKILRKIKQNSSRALSEPGQGPGQGLLAAVRTRLSELGVINKDGSKVLLKSGQPKTLTVDQAKTLRTFIRKSSAPGSNMSAIKGELIDAVDTSVEAAVGEDVFKPARQAFRKNIETFEDDETSSKIVRDIASGTAKPDTLIDKYIFNRNVPAQDLSKLMDVIGQDSPAAKGLKQRVAERILEDSKSQNGTLIFGKLAKGVNGIGDKKLEILFGKEGVNKYKSIMTGLRDTTVAPEGSPINRSNTANETVRRVANMLHEGSMPMAMASMAMGEPSGMLITGAGSVVKKFGELSEKRAQQKWIQNHLTGSAVPDEVKESLGRDPRINHLVRSATVPAATAGFNELNRKR